jgi:phospholipid/cholesterol/gamma-HCH transport system permease protein
MRKFFEKLGPFAYFFISEYGRLAIMLGRAFVAIRKAPLYLKPIVDQFHYIGRKSFPIVLITSAFIGLALGVQIGTQMNPYTPHWMEGGLILRSMLLEMGPILIGLILSGRVAAGISAELGTMKVTEQLDALRSFAIDPIEFLVMPRLIAAMFAVPVLLVFADVTGILAGFFSSHFAINLSWEGFVKGMRYDFHVSDVITSLIKSYIFGIVIVIFGSFFGINSKRGAKGVGQATTLAVVWSSVAVLMLDYLISAVLYFV